MATDLLRLSTKATLRAFNDGFTAMKFPVDFKVWAACALAVAWHLTSPSRQRCCHANR